MAGQKSNYLEAALLNHVLGGNSGGQSYAAPATVYVALFTDTNTAAQRSAGTVTEPAVATWTNYARQPVANTNASFAHINVGATNTKTNAAAVTWPAATMAPTTATVTVTAMGIYDALTGGNLLYWADLSLAKTLSNGDVMSFAAGGITVNEV